MKPIHGPYWSRLFAALLFALVFCVSGSDHADAAKKPLFIPLGKAELISIEGDVADVFVADPSIIDVVAVQSNKLYVTGLEVGDTNLIALDAKGGVVKKLDIHVKYDLTAIQALVDELYPDESVHVGSIHGRIMLTGEVSNASNASKIATVVANYVADLQGVDGTTDDLISNLLDVQGGQQVMLQVRVIEAKRSVLKELGVQTNVNDTITAAPIFGVAPFGSRASGLDTAGLVTGTGLATGNAAAASLRLFDDLGNAVFGNIGLFLDALERESLINVLAEPNLTAVSGEEAGFLAGGETPVPTGLDQLGNIVVEFRQFGVSLNFMPTVLSKSRISLQMSTEVSSINFNNALPAGNIQVPGFDVRRANTTVELGSGSSIMIAGILQSSAIKNLRGLPGIKDTPVIGDLLKSDSFQRDETELVVIVTPYLVEPFAEAQADIVEIPKQSIPQNPVLKDVVIKDPKTGEAGEIVLPVEAVAVETAIVEKNNILADTFADNIETIYKVNRQELFKEDKTYGYILY